MHTGRFLSTRYTLRAPFAARTTATVWIEMVFPNPSPFPSTQRHLQFNSRVNCLELCSRKARTHDAGDKDISSYPVLLTFLDHNAICIDSLMVEMSLMSLNFRIEFFAFCLPSPPALFQIAEISGYHRDEGRYRAGVCRSALRHGWRTASLRSSRCARIGY